MDWLQTLVLAIIQGLTEFLPVSSSAHLILPSQLLGWPDQGLAFDVAVHIGTLVAVIAYYRRTLAGMVQGAWQGMTTRQVTPDLKLGLYIIWATLPAVLCGLLFKDHIEAYARDARVIGFTTILFGIFLWWADARGHRRIGMMDMTLGMVTVIGLAQALALIPGTSRSGITLTAALFLGLRREDGAHFSFLLSIPVILGALVFLLKDLVGVSHPYTTLQLAVAALVSAAVAYVSIAFFLRLVSRIGMAPFALYRLALGGLLLVLFAL